MNTIHDVRPHRPRCHEHGLAVGEPSGKWATVEMLDGEDRVVVWRPDHAIVGSGISSRVVRRAAAVATHVEISATEADNIDDHEPDWTGYYEIHDSVAVSLGLDYQPIMRPVRDGELSGSTLLP